VDLERLTFACATTAEERVARRAGLRAVRVGLRVANGVPDADVVSFGLAGALHDGVRIGDVLDATRVVDDRGETLWEGAPLGVPGARAGTVLASDVLVHDAAERRRLHAASGADAVDMESGVLARSGRLAGVVRAISDVAESAIEGVDRTVHTDGRTDVVGLLRWLVTRRADAVRSLRDAVVALRALERAGACGRRLDGARPGAEAPARPAPEREA
jgi:adenosylhomocysteine nucleosidase